MLLYEEDGTTERVHTYATGRHFAVDETEGTETTRYFTHTDHLGSVTAVTDSDGTLVWDNEYLPFGDEARTTDSRFAMFTGKQKDPDTGLYYYNARWYDTSLGRFVSQDPIRSGVNWYAYCENNPLKFVDPTGLESADAAYSHNEQQKEYESTGGQDNGDEGVSGPTDRFLGKERDPEIGDYVSKYQRPDGSTYTLNRNSGKTSDNAQGESSVPKPVEYDSLSDLIQKNIEESGSVSVDYIEGEVDVELPDGTKYSPEVGEFVPRNAIITAKKDSLIDISAGDRITHIYNGGSTSIMENERLIQEYYQSEEYRQALVDQAIVGVTEVTAGMGTQILSLWVGNRASTLAKGSLMYGRSADQVIRSAGVGITTGIFLSADGIRRVQSSLMGEVRTSTNLKNCIISPYVDMTNNLKKFILD